MISRFVPLAMWHTALNINFNCQLPSGERRPSLDSLPLLDIPDDYDGDFAALSEYLIRSIADTVWRFVQCPRGEDVYYRCHLRHAHRIAGSVEALVLTQIIDQTPYVCVIALARTRHASLTRLLAATVANDFLTIVSSRNQHPAQDLLALILYDYENLQKFKSLCSARRMPAGDMSLAATTALADFNRADHTIARLFVNNHTAAYLSDESCENLFREANHVALAVKDIVYDPEVGTNLDVGEVAERTRLAVDTLADMDQLPAGYGREGTYRLVIDLTTSYFVVNQHIVTALQNTQYNNSNGAIETGGLIHL